jgi:hypothetical protein
MVFFFTLQEQSEKSALFHTCKAVKVQYPASQRCYEKREACGPKANFISWRILSSQLCIILAAVNTPHEQN